MKFSKVFSALCGIAVLCMQVMYAAPAASKPSAADTAGTQNVQPSAPVDESTLPIESTAAAAGTAKIKKSSTAWVLVRMILVLAFVIACIYAVVYFMKQGLKPGADNDPFLRKVSSISLSPGKSVQVVTLLDNAYIIGVTDNAVNLIGQVNDKELVDAMNLYADRSAKNTKPRTFNDILSLFMPNSTASKTVYGDQAKTAADLLKKQRDRLHDGGKNENV